MLSEPLQLISTLNKLISISDKLNLPLVTISWVVLDKYNITWLVKLHKVQPVALRLRRFVLIMIIMCHNHNNSETWEFPVLGGPEQWIRYWATRKTQNRTNLENGSKLTLPGIEPGALSSATGANWWAIEVVSYNKLS